MVGTMHRMIFQSLEECRPDQVRKLVIPPILGILETERMAEKNGKRTAWRM
jgi:hypothetical protein